MSSITINAKNNAEFREKLIGLVLKQLQDDMINHDLTAITELLEFLPTPYLIGFLREEQ